MTLCIVQTQLKGIEHELALGEDTNKDLVTQLSWEKDARKEVLELAFICCSHTPHTQLFTQRLDCSTIA